MFCFLAFLICICLFLFHLAGLALFILTFIITLIGTGDFASAVLASIVAGLTGLAIQYYARKNL